MTTTVTDAMEAKAKERLYRLVDLISEREVHAAERYLEYLAEHGDPFIRKLMTLPEDDEELSEEGHRMLDEGYEDLRAGRTHSLEEVKQEIGR